MDKTNAYCPLSYEMGHNNKKKSGNTYISDEFAEHGECETSLWNVDAARQCEQLFDGVTSSLCQQRSCRNFIVRSMTRYHLHSLLCTGWCIKTWTISFHCLQCVHHTHTENFYNISTVTKTLIKCRSIWTKPLLSDNLRKLCSQTA